MGERVTILHGDCMAVLPTLPADSVHACVTDPPYHLTNNTGARSPYPGQYTPIGKPKQPKGGFMGKQWDGGDIAFRPDLWREVLRVLRPGGHVLAFGGTRTYHRLACAVEDAGFEIRDAIMWHYGSGFPKSHDVSKGIDRAAGAERPVTGSKLDLPGYHLNGHDGGEAFGHGLSSSTPETRLKASQVTAPATAAAREWQGWGTALKPATEIIVLARKPLGKSTVAANVQAFGTGALNIDACRVDAADEPMGWETPRGGIWATDSAAKAALVPSGKGRWPANVLHDGSEEVLRAFPDVKTGAGGITKKNDNSPVYSGPASSQDRATVGYDDSGSAARFFKSCPFSEEERRIFYSSKADAADRLQSKHPTVKPVSLLRYLCRLITPPGGTILDCFAGSGSLAFAAMAEGFNAILIERELEYVTDARRRIAHVSGQDAPLFAQATP